MALIPVEEALSRILSDAIPLPGEIAGLVDAVGRVLCDPVIALRTQPPADMSAMDGYALRAADGAAAGATLRVIGESAAGHAYAGSIAPGEAVRIFTGAILPEGADAVVMQEHVARDGDTIRLSRPAIAAKHIRRAGLDFRKGAEGIPAGRRIGTRDLALIAAMDHAEVGVHRRPRVAILATGDELVLPGTGGPPEAVVASNTFALAAIARAEGAVVTDLGIVPDTDEATRAAIRRAREIDADILITAGGASVGDHDLVRAALEAEGLALSFWRIAMRPGKPLMHGRLGGMQVLGLPGNPVSAIVCGLLFMVPLIRRLSGRADLAAATEAAFLAVDIAANDEREDYVRAALTADAGGRLLVTPFAVQDSSMLSVLSRADALLVRPPHEPARPAGAPCRILRL